MSKDKYRSSMPEDYVGHIYAYGAIGQTGDMDCVMASDFIAQLNYLESLFSEIHIHINSIGGSVVEGYSIFTAILNCNSKTIIHIDGLAASIAGVIAMAGDEICMRDYALLMLHNPHGGDDKSLDAIKETLVTMISKRTKKDPASISKMMDVETWLNADEALDMGFIDRIVETEEKEYIEDKITNLYSVSNSIDSIELYNIFNKKINNNMSNKAEETFFKKLFAIVNKTEETEVSEDSKLSDLEIEIENLKKIIEEQNKSKEELVNKINEFEGKEKEAKEKEVVEFLTNCIDKNIIKSEEFDKFKNLASVDFNTTKELLEKSKVNIGAPTQITNQLIKNELSTIGEGRDKWTLLDWAKNDPKGLEELRTSNAVIYEELLNRSNDSFKNSVKA